MVVAVITVDVAFVLEFVTSSPLMLMVSQVLADVGLIVGRTGRVMGLNLLITTVVVVVVVRRQGGAQGQPLTPPQQTCMVFICIYH